MENIQIIKTATKIYPERIILLSGNGQNVGKTTFACQLIGHLKNLDQKVYALKISPHFHSEHPPHCIFKDERFILSLEKSRTTGKDSSRYLEAGADESFILQVRDQYLSEAINYTFSMIPKEVMVVAESGGLRRLIEPAIFLFLMKDRKDPIKETANQLPDIADRIVIFDGIKFDLNIENIQIYDEQLSLRD